MKKALKITIALVFLSGMIFQMSYGGSGHKKNDPLHHKDLEASSEFGSVLDPNSPLFKKLCAASARDTCSQKR